MLVTSDTNCMFLRTTMRLHLTPYCGIRKKLNRLKPDTQKSFKNIQGKVNKYPMTFCCSCLALTKNDNTMRKLIIKI